MDDEYYEQFSDGGKPTWQRKEEIIPKIKEAYHVLKHLFYEARFDGDGSFGLNNASDRLDESLMWAMKDLKGADNEDFQPPE